MAIEISDRTIGEIFREAVSSFSHRPFLALPIDETRSYYPEGYELSYQQAGEKVDTYISQLRTAGYGPGDRIAFLLENRPEALLYKIACNSLGISWVPINPDYRPAEISYLLQDSNAALLITHETCLELAQAGAHEGHHTIPICLYNAPALPPAKSTTNTQPALTPAAEASLLYTSGSTGTPKGCILSHEYELMVGAWYTSRGGLLQVRGGQERVYNPLPVFHINAGIFLFFGMMLTGNCQIIPERFRRSRWWSEIRQTKATGIHYLGLIVPALMNEVESKSDRDHSVRWGIGAGVEPSLHGAFEKRFGFPLLEVWGMTEMCRILTSCHEPRMINTRAIGRAQPGLELKVVDELDQDVPLGAEGELLVRHSEQTPRKGAFSGYLNQPQATEDAWRGGWFHTGDTVKMDDSGMVFFVDRKKNIIRRSGENIAAAEVENCLQSHDTVAQIAVLAIEDELRDEEVMACIVLQNAEQNEAQARILFNYCFAQLAYYKAPGWILFFDSLPVTGTQKIQKHMIFPNEEDPRKHPNAYDMRALKKR